MEKVSWLLLSALLFAACSKYKSGGDTCAEGTTQCGGTLVQECVAGEWVEQEDCAASSVECAMSDAGEAGCYFRASDSDSVAACIVACNVDWIGDGICDDVCNNIGCGLDGGDCASGTDPLADCDDACEREFIGDGICDEVCSNAACVFDNGDCPVDTDSGTGSDTETTSDTGSDIGSDTGSDTQDTGSIDCNATNATDLGTGVSPVFVLSNGCVKIEIATHAPQLDGQVITFGINGICTECASGVPFHYSMSCGTSGDGSLTGQLSPAFALPAASLGCPIVIDLQGTGNMIPVGYW